MAKEAGVDGDLVLKRETEKVGIDLPQLDEQIIPIEFDDLSKKGYDDLRREISGSLGNFEQMPMQQMPMQQMPAQQVPVQQMPAQQMPAQTTAQPFEYEQK